MGKFRNGVDEIDVMAMIGAISAVHDGRVEVIMRSCGPGFAPSVMVRCQATFAVLDGSRLPKEVGVENPFPCKEHANLYAHVYDGLYRLDAAIQKAYEQAQLPD